MQGGSRDRAGEEASLSASGSKPSKPILSDTLCFGASDASLEKGVWAMALHGTALPHGDFAFEAAMICWHVLGDGASCWETTPVCERLNLCNAEQSKEEKGMLGEERMMLWGKRIVRVLLGGKA